MHMRILLTGPSGFLGSALARYWAVQGRELWLLARSTSSTHRLAGLPESVRLLRACSPDEVMAAVREAAPDAIVHTACAYGRRGETLLDVLDANVRLGTLLLQAAIERPAFHTDSERPVLFLNTGTVLSPEVSLYALSKRQFSAWGAALAMQSPQQLRFVDIRLQQMYGEGDDRSKFITHVIESCRLNEPRLALTRGEQQRDFIHIDDVVRAYDRILARHADFRASDVIEVGSGETISMRGFVELVRQLAGASTELDFGAVPYRAHEAMHCVADTSRLRSLGWQPQVSLSEGLKRLLGPQAPSEQVSSVRHPDR